MDNQLRETAVRLAVWASTQHIIAEVWLGGSRVTDGAGEDRVLEVYVVMVDHAQQVQVRRSGRQASPQTWERDVSASVGQPHHLHILSGQSGGETRNAVRIFSRRDALASEIVRTPARTETPAGNAETSPLNERGEHQYVRTL